MRSITLTILILLILLALYSSPVIGVSQAGKYCYKPREYEIDVPSSSSVVFDSYRTWGAVLPYILSTSPPEASTSVTSIYNLRVYFEGRR